LNVICPLKE